MSIQAVRADHLDVAYRDWQQHQKIRVTRTVEIDGTCLNKAAVVAVARSNCLPRLSTNEQVIGRIHQSVSVLEKHLGKGFFIYGVNTGFGGSADARTSQTIALQSALLQLTQTGVLVEADRQGDLDKDRDIEHHAMPPAWVRAIMLVRCNATARGHSAVSLKVIQAILQLLCHDIIPVVPLRGTVSASGDLMPLAYIAGAVEGSPDVFVQVGEHKSRRVISAREALHAAGLASVILGPKEGLGLVNGTAPSAALASLALKDVHEIAILCQALTAMVVESMLGDSESFHPFIAKVRPHDGQKEVAQNILSLLSGSRLARGIISGRNKNKTGLVQDRYALRSVSQWIGPSLEDLVLADRQVTVELNSSADNPIIDVEQQEIYYGANFQAASITSAMEKARLSLHMFGKLLFAQSTELINPDLNNGLTPNLVADDPSLSFTMKGVDINMAAYLSELAYLANPISTYAQPAEMHNQSINSLAFLSARMTMKGVEVAYLMCACSLYINCQALDLRVMDMKFLSEFRSVLSSTTSECLGLALHVSEIENINLSIHKEFSERWASTSRLDAPERCQTAIASCLASVLDAVMDRDHRFAGSQSAAQAINTWKVRAAKAAEHSFRETQSAFFKHQGTENFLGLGARSLYLAVRQELRVPFHQGFIEHPTVADELANPLNGREKKTIGSWISIIYEALRKGLLQQQVLLALRPPEKECNGVDRHDGTDSSSRQVNGNG